MSMDPLAHNITLITTVPETRTEGCDKVKGPTYYTYDWTINAETDMHPDLHLHNYRCDDRSQWEDLVSIHVTTSVATCTRHLHSACNLNLTKHGMFMFYVSIIVIPMCCLLTLFL